MGYFIFDRTPPHPIVRPDGAKEPDLAGVAAALGTGSAAQRAAIIRQLVAQGAESILVRCLGSADLDLSRLAMDGLWECWLSEKGPQSRARIDAGIAAMNEGNLPEAARIFKGLALDHPDWAEAVNKQATVCYLQGAPEESIALCQEVVKLKPDHFGAWNGMALCAIQCEDWALALIAVEESLRLLPASGYNQQLLRLVESRLPAG